MPQPYELNTLSDHDITTAKKLVELLNEVDFTDMAPVTLHVGDGTAITLPLSVIELLRAALVQLTQGNALTVIPHQAYLTTQQAANLLHVSRPFVVKLLETEKLPFIRVGNRRKILAADLLRFKSNRDTLQQTAITKLVRQAQDDGMGY